MTIPVEHDVPVPMRDGVLLRADVYQPAGPGPHPVLVHRTPYDKRVAQQVVYQHPSWYARRGYLVVAQDTRGRYASDGVFDPYRHEAHDTADTIAWAARLPTASGKVGSYGFSYAGAVQLLGAAQQPTGLACAAPAFTSSDFYDDWTYVGGALNHAFVVSWVLQMLALPDLVKAGDLDGARRLLAAQSEIPRLLRERPLADLGPLRDTGAATYFFDWLSHDTRDQYWQDLSIRERHHLITTPCLHIGGWYDTFIEGTLDNFVRLSARSPDHRLLIGPWAHAPWTRLTGGRDFGEAAGGVVDEAQLAWFDHWLRAAPPPPGPPVRVFVMGVNRWRDESAWPPPGTETVEWYLHSTRGAQSLSGDGSLTRRPPRDEDPDVYVTMPHRPVPSAGGRASSDPSVVPMGPAAQEVVEIRNDVLVYTTAPFQHEVAIIGTVWLTLFAATDGIDCDWTAKLVDVAPDGATVGLCDGILRARSRASLSQPRPVEPDTVVEYRLRVGSTANVFRAGHRLRLQVSSSNFPLYDVNPNTGAVAASAGPFELRPATQTVFHDARYPSRLALPIAPRVG
jgi:putative CocE/NonD family hydrolase